MATPRSSAVWRAPLYEKLVPAPHTMASEQVAAIQRERLCGAMMHAVAEQGYEGASISHVCALAGVSKRTLYQRFAGKEECFLATYEQIGERALARVSEALHRDCLASLKAPGNRTRREAVSALGDALDALLAAISEHPKAARLALVEAPATGAIARAAIDRTHAAFERVLIAELGQVVDGVSPFQRLARGIVCGLESVLQIRLFEPLEPGLSGIGSELVEWLFAYSSPCALSLERLSAAAPLVQAKSGGGARASQRAIRGNERARMLRAAARIAAAGGLESLTSGQIVQAACADVDAFSREFESVEQCFLAAFEFVCAEALVRALREGERAAGWTSATCRALQSLLAQVAHDPVLARVAFVEILAAGRPGIERRAALMRSFAAVLSRRAPRSSRPSQLVAQATVGAVWGLIGNFVRSGRLRELPSLEPHVSYLALAPIVGAERAVEGIHRELAVPSTDYIAA